MESQLGLMGEVIRCTDKLNKEQMQVMAAQVDFTSEVYKEGALSIKVKRLIALGIALRAGCVECIIPQTKRAVEAGATKDCHRGYFNERHYRLWLVMEGNQGTGGVR